MDCPDDDIMSHFCLFSKAKVLPVLGQTYLMTKCLVANFTRVWSENIKFENVVLMLKRIVLPASIMTPSYMHL